jgi:transporter family protein
LPPTSAILYEILGGVTVALIVFLYLGGKAQFDAKGAAISYAVGLLGFTGTLAYFWAVTKGPVSIIAVLSAMYPIIAVLLGVFVLHETLSLRQMLGIGLSMAGLWFLVKPA